MKLKQLLNTIDNIKKFVIFLLLIVIFISVQSQNVGIGGTAFLPLERLHIEGNEYLNGNLYVKTNYGSGSLIGTVHHGTSGLLGQTTTANLFGMEGFWLEGSSDGEGAGIFMNGNSIYMWSPGDADIFRIYDEDDFPAINTPKFVINGTGYVGINKSVPTQWLDVVGNVQFSGALMPNGLSGNSGQVLKSNGAGVAPSWAGAVTSQDIYSVESTAGITLNSGWQIITGESITINGLTAGDRCIIQYSGNALMNTVSYANVDVAAFVNGAMISIGGYVRLSLDYDVAWISWQNFSSIARYTIPANGDYTFDVRAMRASGSGTITVGGNSTQAAEGVLVIYVLKN